MKYIITLALALISLLSYSQDRVSELGVHGGLLYIYGDNSKDDSKEGFGAGVSLRVPVNNAFSISGELFIGDRINTTLLSLSTNLLYSFPSKHKFDFYTLAGANLFNSYNNSVNNTSLGLNVGAGLGYKFKHASLYLEPTLTYSYNDDIDGINSNSILNRHNDVMFYIPLKLCWNISEKNEYADNMVSWWINPLEEQSEDIELLEVELDVIYKRLIDAYNTPVKVDTVYITEHIEKTKEVFIKQEPPVDSALFEVLPIIYFENNSSIVDSTFNNKVYSLYLFMTKYPHIKLLVKGYTSSNGSVRYNKELAYKRCNNIIEVLVEYGVSSDRLISVPYGELDSLDSVSRRVEFIIIY